MSESKENPAYGRILFVDKDSSMRWLMKSLLSRHFQVVTTGSAEEGLALVESEAHFDIVISGFTLLWMNGLEFLRRVGKICPQTVRILMSDGCGDTVEINQAISEGQISRLVLKPFCMSTIMDQLKNDLALIRAGKIPS